MNPLIDEYIAKAKKWQTEMQALRSILLDFGLAKTKNNSNTQKTINFYSFNIFWAIVVSPVFTKA